MPKNARDSSLELVRANLAAQRNAIIENQEATRLGRDVEALHRMRVATQRTHALLRTPRIFLDPESAERLRLELTWLGGVLGGVRDVDVLIAHLRAETDTLGAAERAALTPLFDRLAAERRKARTSVLRALKS